MLTCMNYNEWSLIIECNLHAASLRVSMDDDLVTRKQDRHDIVALIHSTKPEIYVMLMAQTGTNEVWAAFRTQRLSSNNMHEANTHKLWVDFHNITFKEGELVYDFTMQISSLVT